MIRYGSSKHDCDDCVLKPKCCPNTTARKIPRSIHAGARDIARDIDKTEAYVKSRRERKKDEMLLAHLKRILRLDRLQLRRPNGALDEFHLSQHLDCGWRAEMLSLYTGFGICELALGVSAGNCLPI